MQGEGGAGSSYNTICDWERRENNSGCKSEPRSLGGCALSLKQAGAQHLPHQPTPALRPAVTRESRRLVAISAQWADAHVSHQASGVT